jgi:Zn-dependent protease with chaperone function
MDFFEHQERARRKTGLLVVYFVAAIVLIILAVYVAIAGILFYGQSNREHGPPPMLWYPDVFAAVGVGTVALISIGSLYKIAELSSGGEVVARTLGGRPVPANTQDLRERVLLNVVEEMAIASGIPVPPVFVLDHELAINAFAAGTTPQNAVISVTRGTIETLKRDELQGVIAHEFSHILNGDMRLNLRLIGILNGILLIAMTGYLLMRSTAYVSASSRSSGDDKKGGNPLPLLGLCLLIIGYIGVFFGKLIKSAVSRQREFLADASAVQFTRYPDGIAGALKKIGGFQYGSRLRTPNAEEASHLFFGNGLAMPFLQLLATHPPLVERIRRIDPTFDGQFPPVSAISYSSEDLVDTSKLAAGHARAVKGAAGRAAALKGSAVPLATTVGMAFEPAAAVAQVGAPQSEHLDYASALLGSLPSEIASHVRDPLGAVATIYALLLDESEPEVRQKQLDYLAKTVDSRANQETLRLAPFAAKVSHAARLPVVSLALPALNGLSPQQLVAFRNDLESLIKADNRVSLFDYAVHRLVLHRLLPRLEQKQSPTVRYNQVNPLLTTCRGLLSTLAYLGSEDESEAARAFHLGVEKLGVGGAGMELLPRNRCGLKVVDAALDQLTAAAPMVKKQVIESCAACIGADGRVTVEEGELLRVISDSLDCPMPPILDSGS